MVKGTWMPHRALGCEGEPSAGMAALQSVLLQQPRGRRQGSLPHSVWRRPCHGMVLWTFIFCTLTLPPSTTTAMFTQSTAKQGTDKTTDSSSKGHLPSGPAVLWLHPDLLPWWRVGLVCPFQTVFHLPNRWPNAYIPCILISWVQLRRWPHVSDLQIWGGGVFPLVFPYSAKGDVRERAETVFISFPSWHQSLQLGQSSWFLCVWGGRLYVCRFICMSSNVHVEARVNLRLYSSGTMHLAFETGSLCGRRGLQTRWGLQTRRGWLGRGPQRSTCLHLPSIEGAPTSGLFCIGPYFV